MSPMPISKIIEKLFCLHDMRLVYSREWPDVSYVVFSCSKCGKIVKKRV